MKKMILMVMVIPLLLISNKPVAAEDTTNLQEETIYNILVDRYNNGDPSLDGQKRIDDPYAYHGGDIKGITKKLDEIQGLGFTTISLSPIMKNAPDGYHGYWIEDYFKVEKQFGSIEDVQTLVKEAHKRDMKVVLEFVTNYIADSHEIRSEEHTSELQSRGHLVCRPLLEK